MSKGEKASSGVRHSSTPSLAILKRPVVARLIEPTALTLGTLYLSQRSPLSTVGPTLITLAAYLVLRLVCDTSPNLVVSSRLEEVPYDERLIRRALARVKLTLALGAALMLSLSARWLDAHIDGVATISQVLGGPIGILLSLGLALASFAAATPAVREHRGVPIARPSLGAASAAVAFAIALPFLTPTPSRICQTLFLLLVVGNVTLGTWQRYRAVSQRLRHPVFSYAYADSGASSRSRASEESFLFSAAMKIVPFVLFPALPVVFAALAQNRVNAISILALFAACIPPILYDAKQNSVPFRLASFLSTLFLVVLWKLDVTTSPPSVPASVALETALLVLVYPAASRLIERRSAGTLGCAVFLLILSKLTLSGFSIESRWPIPELLFGIFVVGGTIGCQSLRRR